jgi:hypothetical protein
VVDN